VQLIDVVLDACCDWLREWCVGVAIDLVSTCVHKGVVEPRLCISN